MVFLSQGRSWIVVDNLQIYRFGKGIWIEMRSNNITIKNSTVVTLVRECVRLTKRNSNNLTIEATMRFTTAGRRVMAKASMSGRTLSRREEFRIELKTSPSRNNEIYNTRNEAIELKAGTSDCIVQNNLIYKVNDSARGAIHSGHWADPLIIPNHLIDSNFIHNVNG